MERRPPSICSHYPCNPISFSLSVSLSHSLSYVCALIFTPTAGICLEWRHILTHSEWESFWGFIYTRSTSLVPCWIIIIVPALLSLSHLLSDDTRIAQAWAHTIKWTHSFRASLFSTMCRTDARLWIHDLFDSLHLCVLYEEPTFTSNCKLLFNDYRSPAFIWNTLFHWNPALPTAAHVRKCFRGVVAMSNKSDYIGQNTTYLLKCADWKWHI